MLPASIPTPLRLNPTPALTHASAVLKHVRRGIMREGIVARTTW